MGFGRSNYRLLILTGYQTVVCCTLKISHNDKVNVVRLVAKKSNH